jgi:hypothetical protein
MNYSIAKRLIFLFAGITFSLLQTSLVAQNKKIYQADVLVIGGGTGGTAAGIGSARFGAQTIIVEPSGWLGGMLTAAGVSATDGNDRLPSGIWQEFREKLYQHYGGPAALSTGWVSNTLFEPHVGDSIFKAMAAREKKLQVIYHYRFRHVLKENNRVTGAVFSNDKGRQIIVRARITIDGTELGDVIKDAGVPYNVGLDARSSTGEAYALDSAMSIIQDITYTAILKDYGPASDKTIARPVGYDSTAFLCSCKSAGCSDAAWGCEKMLAYGKLPNGKYMINWPGHGNDIYINAIEMNNTGRQQAYQRAKEKTLDFVYYIQHQLGYKHLGLADDEFPTKDKLPFIPYNREGRRGEGVIRFTVNDIQHPYDQEEKLYRTAIAVGDYPVDQHHNEYPHMPVLHLPRVPSFGIPMGCLIPPKMDGLLFAEKDISVSNLANGATRLQPCVLLTGQAAGLLAAYAAIHHVEPREVKVRDIQKILLDAGAYLLPFIDVKPENIHFKAIQRIGVTGIIRGVGIPYTWANQTWFYPHRHISEYELVQGLSAYYPAFENYYAASGETLTVRSLLRILGIAGKSVSIDEVKKDWANFHLDKDFSEHLQLDREMAAVLVNYYLDPFDRPVDLKGRLANSSHQ